jgi:hypothetical protein
MFRDGKNAPYKRVRALSYRRLTGSASADLPRPEAAKLVRDHESLGHGG